MSFLANTQSQIAKTNTMIAREERALVEHPDCKEAILRSIASLKKVQGQLEAQFSEAANSAGVDICTYRVLSEEGTYHIASVAEALSSFQKAVSVVYDALKNGPKQRMRVGPEAATESTFDFSYCFAGSVGFALTIPNERLLADIQSTLDDAIDKLFSLARSAQPADIAQQAKELGHGPVRAVRQWAGCLAQAGLGAEICWQRGKDLRNRLLIQRPELQHLCNTIDEKGGEAITTREVVGELCAANVRAKSFSMQLEGDEIIHGSFSDAISEAHSAELPHRYRAKLTKTVQVNYATDDENVSYHLTELSPV